MIGFFCQNLYKVTFSGGIVAGWDDGSSWAADEYGRSRRHPRYQDKEQHSREWRTTLKAKESMADQAERKIDRSDAG
jgi:hypothetical protein